MKRYRRLEAIQNKRAGYKSETTINGWKRYRLPLVMRMKDEGATFKQMSAVLNVTPERCRVMLNHGEAIIRHHEKNKNKPEPELTQVLTPRTANALINNGITTMKQLRYMTEQELRELKGFGQRGTNEVAQKLMRTKENV